MWHRYFVEEYRLQTFCNVTAETNYTKRYGPHKVVNLSLIEVLLLPYLKSNFFISTFFTFTEATFMITLMVMVYYFYDNFSW